MSTDALHTAMLELVCAETAHQLDFTDAPGQPSTTRIGVRQRLGFGYLAPERLESALSALSSALDDAAALGSAL